MGPVAECRDDSPIRGVSSDGGQTVLSGPEWGFELWVSLELPVAQGFE
jgi:hypothetical protein